MWIYSPTLCVAAGTITCVLVLVGQVWFDKLRRTGKDYECAIILTGRRMMRAAFAFVGLFLFDAAMRICFSSLLSYGSFIRYALASVILCIVLAILLVIGTVFIAPTWKSLTVFFIILGAALFISITSYTGSNQVEPEDMFYVAAVGMGLTLVLDIVDFFHGFTTHRKANAQQPGDGTDKKEVETMRLFKNPGEIMSRPIWDVSGRFKVILGTKVQVVVFMLFSAELILLFEGMSLLFWL